MSDQFSVDRDNSSDETGSRRELIEPTSVSPEEVYIDLTSSSRVPSTTEERSNTKRPRTEEEKKSERLEANRLSARKSREKKRKLQDNLESSVVQLTEIHAQLTEENESLKNMLRSTIQLQQSNPMMDYLSSQTSPLIQQVDVPCPSLEIEIMLMQLQQMRVNQLLAMQQPP